MPTDNARHPAAASRWLAPVEPRYAPLFCFGLLTLSCALASFVFACVTPFAAFATVAAAMLPWQPALLVVAAAWLVNQTIGFSLLHYPVDTNTVLWGLVIGIAALAGSMTSAAVLRSIRRANTAVALGAALIATYATYELVLFAATPFLGGAQNFTAAIVGRLGLLSVAWTIGLVAACEIARLFNHALGRKTVS